MINMGLDKLFQFYTYYSIPMLIKPNMNFLGDLVFKKSSITVYQYFENITCTVKQYQILATTIM